ATDSEYRIQWGTYGAIVKNSPKNSFATKSFNLLADGVSLRRWRTRTASARVGGQSDRQATEAID
ncbi:hypothetical protein, partial [Nostoc sp. JL33]|uniref:hypothetical protein n=1 Tax=Nostoc sp. JL33 TaxID=2815396 RepID=UPI0025E54403